MRELTTKSRFVFITPLVLTLCGSAETLAEESAPWREYPLGNRFSLGVGLFGPTLDTKVRLDSSNGVVGTAIDFESTLGMDENDRLPLVTGYYRFAKRHRMTFEYFRLDRTGLAVSDAPIRFGDVIFPANLPLSSYFNVDVYSFSYSYSIIHDRQKELAFSFGLQFQDIETGIAGSIGPGLLSEEADAVAPLPTFGGSFDYAISEKWIFTSMIGVFGIEIDLGDDSDFSGEIVHVNAGILWKAFENVGFAFQYNYFNVDVGINDPDWVGALKYQYRGPVLAVSWYF
jgi:hypothetical protein